MGRSNRDQARLSVKNGIDYKECTKCGETFPNTKEFFFYSGKFRVDGTKILRGDCKKCKQSYSNKARQINYARFKNYKLQLSCQECGFPSEEDKKKFGDYWVYALDYNHRDPTTKVIEVSKLAASAGKEKLMKEMAKCDVLCANCHRIYTYKLLHATKAKKLAEQEKRVESTT